MCLIKEDRLKFTKQGYGNGNLEDDQGNHGTTQFKKSWKKGNSKEWNKAINARQNKLKQRLTPNGRKAYLWLNNNTMKFRTNVKI